MSSHRAFALRPRLLAGAVLALAGLFGLFGPSGLAATGAEQSAAAAKGGSTTSSAPAGARWVTVGNTAGWFAPLPRQVAPPPLPERAGSTYVIPIREPIDEKTGDAVKRKVVEAKARGADLVVFDMDTPGGRSSVMNDIVGLITVDLAGIRTVAFVNQTAFSAGAIISLACNEVVMTPGGRIGDAMPIMIGPGGLLEIPEKERGKFESAARSDIRALAQRNGYDVGLCEAMITITIELWLVRNRQTAEMRIVEAGEWRGKVAGLPPDKRSTTMPADENRAEWEYVRLVDGPGELVTLTADQAQLYGITTTILPDMQALRRHYGGGELVVLGDNWSEKLVEVLTSPTVSGLLFFAGLVLGYLELKSGGFGVFGVLALVCLGLFFGSRYLTGLAQWWEIALIFVGVALLLLEIFVIPGFGVAGLAGILLILVGLVAAVVPNRPDEAPIPKTDVDWTVFGDTIFAMALGLGAFIILAVLITRHLPRIPLARRVVLPEAPAVDEPPVMEQSATLTVKRGDVGTAITLLRPAGRARIGSALVDVVTEGEWLDTGTAIRVLANDGNRIVVERNPLA
jgi:membrane-bound serine protease (ClpP class)